MIDRLSDILKSEKGRWLWVGVCGLALIIPAIPIFFLNESFGRFLIGLGIALIAFGYLIQVVFLFGRK